MQLTQQEFITAANYLKTKARPLEAALFAYEFEAGSAEPAVRALAAYQNPDGGFGHALEPDLRLTDPSIIATTTALPHFRTLGLPADHPLVKGACLYLNSQYLAAERRWCIMPANVDDAPHAPWWVVGGDLWNSRVNPTAMIAGALYEFPSYFDAVPREEVASQLVAHLQAHDGAMEMHDLLCYVDLVENPAVPETLKAALLEKLTRVVSVTVERSVEQWLHYSLPPLAIISSPQSPFVGQFTRELPQNFEFMLSGRGEDGAWHPNWSWGESALAKQVAAEWSGVLTLSNLKKLRAFGMIAGRE